MKIDYWIVINSSSIIWTNSELDTISNKKIYTWKGFLPSIFEDESFLSWFLRLCSNFNITPAKLLTSEKRYWHEYELLELGLIEYGYSWLWMFDIKKLPAPFIKTLGKRGIKFKPEEYQSKYPSWIKNIVSNFDTDFSRQMMYIFESELSYCPNCWKDERYFKISWRNPFHIICLYDGFELKTNCDKCNAALWTHRDLHKFENLWFTNCPHCGYKLISNNIIVKDKQKLIDLQIEILDSISQFIEDEKSYKRYWQNVQLNLRILGEASVFERLKVLQICSIRIVNDRTKYYCVKTGKIFSSLQSFRSHAKMDVSGYYCPNCKDDNFVTDLEYGDHLAICGKDFTCKKCNRNDFTRFSIYQNHIDTCRKHRCMICGEYLSSIKKLNLHVKLCAEKLKCDNCGISGFRNYDQYSDHKISCRSKCDTCQKSNSQVLQSMKIMFGDVGKIRNVNIA